MRQEVEAERDKFGKNGDETREHKHRHTKQRKIERKKKERKRRKKDKWKPRRIPIKTG